MSPILEKRWVLAAQVPLSCVATAKKNNPTASSETKQTNPQTSRREMSRTWLLTHLVESHTETSPLSQSCAGSWGGGARGWHVGVTVPIPGMGADQRLLSQTVAASDMTVCTGQGGIVYCLKLSWDVLSLHLWVPLAGPGIRVRGCWRGTRTEVVEGYYPLTWSLSALWPECHVCGAAAWQWRR